MRKHPLAGDPMIKKIRLDHKKRMRELRQRLAMERKQIAEIRQVNKNWEKTKKMKNRPMSAPGFWANETGGELSPAVEAYLTNQPLTDHQIAIMREYLRQWINAPGWKGDETLIGLRVTVNLIRNRKDLNVWLRTAMNLGIDPL